MFSQAVCLSTGGVSVQGGGSVSKGRGLCWGVSVWGSLLGGLCPRGLCWGVSVQGGLCQGDPPYSYMRAVRILLECILV